MYVLELTILAINHNYVNYFNYTNICSEMINVINYAPINITFMFSGFEICNKN